MKNNLLEYSEMITRMKEFYNSLDIDIPDECINEAVISLAMPDYVKEFKENKKSNTFLKNDHRALATVGDAVCEAYWMKKNTKYLQHKKN